MWPAAFASDKYPIASFLGLPPRMGLPCSKRRTKGHIGSAPAAVNGAGRQYRPVPGRCDLRIRSQITATRATVDAAFRYQKRWCLDKYRESPVKSIRRKNLFD
jgi:hypothetical protein